MYTSKAFISIVSFLILLALPFKEVQAQTSEVQAGIYKNGNFIDLKFTPSSSNIPKSDYINLVFALRYPEQLGTITFNFQSNPLLIMEQDASVANTNNSFVDGEWRYRTFAMAMPRRLVPSSTTGNWPANTPVTIATFSVSGYSPTPQSLELIDDDFVKTDLWASWWFETTDQFGNATDRSNTGTPFLADKIITTLPVELLTFTAKPTATATLLNWATTWEQNNKGFEVMKRLEGEAEFKKIGFVSGKGASTQIENYKFEDKQLFSGTAYYMLRQIDFDNTASNSQIVAVNNRQKAQLFLSIYPNPTTSLVRFNTTSEVNLFTVNLYSTDGKLVLTKEVKNGEDLSVAHLPQGMYQLIYNTQTGETGSGKLIIQK